jgi:DNA-directed RNA polymerase alpha subunit
MAILSVLSQLEFGDTLIIFKRESSGAYSVTVSEQELKVPVVYLTSPQFELARAYYADQITSRVKEAIARLAPDGEKKALPTQEEKTPPKERPIDILELTVRAGNCLRSENIYTIEELVKHKKSDLKKIYQMGRVSLNEVVEALESIGEHLKGESKP